VRGFPGIVFGSVAQPANFVLQSSPMDARVENFVNFILLFSLDFYGWRWGVSSAREILCMVAF